MDGGNVQCSNASSKKENERRAAGPRASDSGTPLLVTASEAAQLAFQGAPVPTDQQPGVSESAAPQRPLTHQQPRYLSRQSKVLPLPTHQPPGCLSQQRKQHATPTTHQQRG